MSPKSLTITPAQIDAIALITAGPRDVANNDHGLRVVFEALRADLCDAVEDMKPYRSDGLDAGLVLLDLILTSDVHEGAGSRSCCCHHCWCVSERGEWHQHPGEPCRVHPERPIVQKETTR